MQRINKKHAEHCSCSTGHSNSAWVLAQTASFWWRKNWVWGEAVMPTMAGQGYRNHSWRGKTILKLSQRPRLSVHTSTVHSAVHLHVLYKGVCAKSQRRLWYLQEEYQIHMEKRRWTRQYLDNITKVFFINSVTTCQRDCFTVTV